MVILAVLSQADGSRLSQNRIPKYKKALIIQGFFGAPKGIRTPESLIGSSGMDGTSEIHKS